jgi:D-tyrosyl-tRNA(Tyr) deacylase
VYWAEVETDDKIVGRIGPGLLVYAAVAPGDRAEDARKLAEKIVNLRIFRDEEGKMNRTVQDVRGGVLTVSNFTLLADARKGRRPAFDGAAPAESAQPLQEAFVAALKERISPVECGVFRADMIIRSAADGPVNIIADMPPLPDPPMSERPKSLGDPPVPGQAPQ